MLKKTARNSFLRNERDINFMYREEIKGVIFNIMNYGDDGTLVLKIAPGMHIGIVASMAISMFEHSDYSNAFLNYECKKNNTKLTKITFMFNDVLITITEETRTKDVYLQYSHSIIFA